MAVDCRDWLKTLWQASFKGQGFYFDTDTEEGGRDNVKHQFPNRDDPYIEDLGERLRTFSGEAYVFGDNVDAVEAAMKSALSSRGAGTLVTPLSGPVSVHCEKFKRVHEKDKLGYAAFEVEFVRSGASSALISVPLAKNIAFNAAAAAATAIAVSLSPALTTGRGTPDFVVSAASDMMLSAAAAIDVVRTTYPVDVAASSGFRDRIAVLVDDIPAAVLAGDTQADAVAASLVSIVRDVADAMPAASAIRAMAEYADSFEYVVADSISVTAQLASTNAQAVARVARLAALTAYAEAILRSDYRSRPEGIAARAAVAERFEAEEYDTTGAANAALYLAIEDLRGSVIDYLSREITDLAPLITVESARILPALFIAWRLYADPVRDAELVERNSVRHPSFMPRKIVALSR